MDGMCSCAMDVVSYAFHYTAGQTQGTILVMDNLTLKTNYHLHQLDINTSYL